MTANKEGKNQVGMGLEGLVFPADPGKLFEGVDTIDLPREKRDELARINPHMGLHDPHLFKDDATGLYYTTGSGKGGHLRRSKDLIHWEFLGGVLPSDAPEAAKEWCDYSESIKAGSIWAPELFKVGDEYRLYYSVSTFGHRLSYIGMAVAEKPEGPYTDRGEIVKTTEESPVNAIDPSLVIDVESGRHFMNFGSFWGGIRQIELDPKTGLRLENGQPYYGKSLWKRNQRVKRAIEGSIEIYNPDTGYYYLFVSYDFTHTDYNIRVARSRCVNGPFYDQNGWLVTDTHTGVDPDAIGLKIVDCHQFENHFGWAATGHNGVLRDGDRYFISYHSHPTANMPVAAQRIHQMIFDRDGWPLVNPCQYAGETLQKISPEHVVGTYERICLDKPDGNLCRQSKPMNLYADGKAEMDGQVGTWKMVGDYEIEFLIGDRVEYSFAIPSFDIDTGRNTLALTGRRSDGICTWAKKKGETCE